MRSEPEKPARERVPDGLEDPWELNEIVRRRRLREQARRPLAVNLAETLELSEFLGALRAAPRR
jgi:hypothetical protein